MSFINAQTGNILQAGSGLLGGVGDLLSARQEEKVGDFNAQVLQQRAEAARANAKLLEFQKRKVLEATIGTQVAMYAKSGIKMSGSPIDVMVDSLANANLEIAIDKYNAEIEARGFESEAQLEKFESRQRASLLNARSSSKFLKSSVAFSKLGGKADKLGEEGGKKPKPKIEKEFRFTA